MRWWDLQKNKPLLSFPWPLPGRFIPAGAGNSHFRVLQSFTESVYPRWGGELQSPRKQLRADAGLSPLARGTLPPSTIRASMLRFIPAGAGNSCPSSIRNTAAAVYPRWRGELDWTRRWGDTKNGLSPLARGTHYAARFPDSKARFIPAGAGNSAARER